MIHPAQGMLKVNHRSKFTKSGCHENRGTTQNNRKQITGEHPYKGAGVSTNHSNNN